MLFTRSTALAGFLLAAVSLVGCRQTEPGKVTAVDAEVYDGIAADEAVRFTGTEPFWGGEVTGESLTYTTLENPDGETIAVKRFAGMNGLGYSGELDGKSFDMTVTPGECSDGMSDRTYPFTVTLSIADGLRNGCGWTAARPFTGDEMP